MNNVFPIDVVRAIIEQTLLEQHIAQPTKYFGGSNQVNLHSFYEQLQKEEDVDRFVEVVEDLAKQQNRSGLIMNGTIIAPENPTITNLYLDTIIPMSFTCSFRVTLGDRDKAISTINNLIEKLKGRKQDVALFENGQIFKTQTLCNEVGISYHSLRVAIGDYLGSRPSNQTVNTFITTRLAELSSIGIYVNEGFDSIKTWFYYEDLRTHTLKVAGRVNSTHDYHALSEEDLEDYPDVILPPQGSFEKYKVSMSFDSIRCDEPRNLNAKEYCTISFGGSATLVNNGVALGNDLVKLGITKNKIIASPNIVITPNENLLSNATWLEPLEMPSGNNANSITNLLNSNRFNTNSHTTNITIANQYSFVVDRSISLLDQLYKYARWGYFGVDNSGETADYTNAITPNMIFRVYEVNSSWGDVEINYIDAKIVEDISIENTESDTLSMTLTLQKQGGEDISGGGSGGGGGSSTDYVTTDTEQTITAKKTFTNQVVFTNTLSNGTYVYLLPQESGRLATQEWVQTFTGDLSGYVKTSGNQDVNGVKTFKSATYTIGLLPYEVTGITNSIGANGYEWSRVYTDSIYNGAFRNALFSTTGQTLYGQTKLQYNDVDDTPLKITFDNDNAFAIDIVDKDNTSYHCYIGLDSSSISHNMKLYLPYDNLGTNNEQTIATQEWVLNKSYATNTQLGNYVTKTGSNTISAANLFTGQNTFYDGIEIDTSTNNGSLVIVGNSVAGDLIYIADDLERNYYYSLGLENSSPTANVRLALPNEPSSLSTQTKVLATRDWVQNNYSSTNYYLTNGSWSGMTYTFTSNGGNPAVSFTLPSTITQDTHIEYGKKLYFDYSQGNAYIMSDPNNSSPSSYLYFNAVYNDFLGEVKTPALKTTSILNLSRLSDNETTMKIGVYPWVTFNMMYQGVGDEERNTKSTYGAKFPEMNTWNENHTIAMVDDIQNALTPTQVGTYATTTTISTDSGNYNGFQFNVGTSDNNGLYVFTFGNAMVLLPCYGLQVGTEYKICATLVNSISGGYDNYVLTYRITSNGYLQIYNRRNVIPNGYNAFLFKVKLY